MTDLVLTVTAEDRPGLVAQLADVVVEHGGSWTGSRMAHLADTFAGVVLVTVPAARVDELRESLDRLGDSGIAVATRVAGAERTPAGGEELTLTLVGQDRPGIVQQVAGALAQAGVGIEEMETETREAPMAGGLLFETRATLALPAGVGADAVRAALEEIADELLVELTLHDASEGEAGAPTTAGAGA